MNLTPAERIALISSVLHERDQITGSTILVDACSLDSIVAAQPGGSAQIAEPYRSRLRTYDDPGCPRDLPRADSAPIVRVETIRPNRGEALSPWGTPLRASGLVVVRLKMSVPRASTRIEEFVMQRLQPNTWGVVTVRIFAFGYM